MKALSFVLLLMASMAFVLLGCSDNTTQPVSPTDQSVGVPPLLAKYTETPFEGLMWQDVYAPGFLVDAGVVKFPDGKILIKGVEQKVVCAANFPAGSTDLFSGNAVVTLNGIADNNTGVGDFYGKITVTPTNGGGGRWELTWHAKGTLGPITDPLGLLGPIGWTIPLKELGPGKGGTLTGMHVFMDNTVLVNPDFIKWTGAYTGYIKSH
jgi:hypothetical protein